MSNKTAGIILLVVFVLFVLLGGMTSYIDVSVSVDDTPATVYNQEEWGEGQGQNYTCTGTRSNMVCIPQ